MPLPRRCRGLHHFVALDPGTRLGPYEILAPAGAGGMGEVYRARDIRLNRLVAVKILSAATAASPQALERFEREAKAIAALSHPGICSIYDVGTEPLLFLVMELLEGPTLHQQLQRGPFDVDSLIDFERRAPAARVALPTIEHYVPVVVAAGAAAEQTPPINFPITGFWLGSFTKRSVQFG